MKNLLFDLDGTLVDSSQGIINAFTYTFTQMNLEVPDVKVLSTFIGPPLETTFDNFFTDKTQVEIAIQHFREFYKKEGVYQVHLYKGIPEMLDKLKSSEYTLYVTTSKHEPMAIHMLEELGIDNYFTKIYGSMSNRFVKADVVKACLEEEALDTDQTVIIGDTQFDIIGGKVAGIKTLGVTWGFGTESDLIIADADQIAHSPKEILSLL